MITPSRRARITRARPISLFAILGAMLLSVLCPPASAQTLVGARAGVNFANVHGDEIGATGFRTGVLGGVWLRSHLASPVSLQLEALYSRQGFSESDEGVSAGLAADYLVLPALLQFHAREDRWAGVFSVGAAYERLRKCRVSVTVEGFSAQVDCALLAEDGSIVVQDWDLAAIIGVGAETRGDRWVLGLEFRTTLGFREALLVETGRSDPFYAEGRNGIFQFQAYAAVPIGD